MSETRELGSELTTKTGIDWRLVRLVVEHVVDSGGGATLSAMLDDHRNLRAKQSSPQYCEGCADIVDRPVFELEDGSRFCLGVCAL